MFLNVEYYNNEESIKKWELPNRFLQAFQPEIFEKIGFPSKINSNKEVFRFIDSMHDGRLDYYYNIEKMQPTRLEFEKIKELCKDISGYTCKRYSKNIIVKAPLLTATTAVRIIKALTDANNIPTIFEIGGGSGMVGAMLHKEGYPYISTDITQAFYITQNNLWEGLFPDKVEECFEMPVELKDTDKIYHIPYWNLWKLRESELEADIIVANHCLAEMHEYSLRFYLAYGKQLLRNSKYKLLIAQAPGTLKFRNMEFLMRTFWVMGYELLYSDSTILVLSLQEKENSMPIDYSEWLSEYKNSNLVYLPEIENLNDDSAALIYKFKKQINKEEKVSLDEIKNYFYSLGKNTDTPDEEFIHYIGYKFI